VRSTGERKPVRRLEAHPEFSRRPKDIFELERRLGCDRLLALDDLVDHLRRPSHLLSELALGHAPCRKLLGEDLAGRDRHIGVSAALQGLGDRNCGQRVV